MMIKLVLFVALICSLCFALHIHIDDESACEISLIKKTTPSSHGFQSLAVPLCAGRPCVNGRCDYPCACLGNTCVDGRFKAASAAGSCVGAACNAKDPKSCNKPCYCSTGGKCVDGSFVARAASLSEETLADPTEKSINIQVTPSAKEFITSHGYNMNLVKGYKVNAVVSRNVVWQAIESDDISTYNSFSWTPIYSVGATGTKQSGTVKKENFDIATLGLSEQIDYISSVFKNRAPGPENYLTVNQKTQRDVYISVMAPPSDAANRRVDANGIPDVNPFYLTPRAVAPGTWSGTPVDEYTLFFSADMSTSSMIGGAIADPKKDFSLTGIASVSFIVDTNPKGTSLTITQV